MLYSESRNVIFVGPFVLKVPSWKNWPSFLEGLTKNIREAQFYSHPDCPCPSSLCPVLPVLPWGLACIMPRAKPLNAAAWQLVQQKAPSFLRQMTGGHLDSFGQLRSGRVVAVDYGSPVYP